MLPSLPLFLLSAGALAADAEAPKTAVDLSGLYTAWGLTQRGFLLGADNPLDDADYVVQMLRVNASFSRPRYGVTTRFDAAQGWWGVDNDPDVEAVPVVAEDGTVSTGTSYNTYKLFGSKDTNYGVHFDIAYAWAELPLPGQAKSLKLRVQVGRQYMGVGHKLVLDENLDGVQLQLQAAEGLRLEAWGAKVSEGEGSYKAPSGLLMSDEEPHADANLAGGRALLGLDPLNVELFGLYYADNSGSGTASFNPNGLGHFNSRFRPNLSTVTALGAAVDGTLDVASGLVVALEGDFLFGTDEVANTDHAGALLDINDGTLRGWNAYAALTQKLEAGIPLEVGGLFGMGSGDDDVTSGPGNINKIQTMGFFNLTNVWEDSVMPDVEGISPQGLGSPISRGYRELENTTAVQGSLAATPVKPLRFEASYTWLHATQPVVGFDATGVPTGTSASDLGQEIDANFVLNIHKGLSYSALFGYFIPGDAAGFLINGTTDSLDAAWEIKQVFTAKF